MQKHTYVVVDTETGGLDPYVHSLLEVGIIVRLPDGTQHELDLRIKEPEIVIDDYLINHVTDGSNKLALASLEPDWEGDTPAVACNKIAHWLNATLGEADPKTVYGSMHNVAFDSAYMRRLWQLGQASGLPVPRIPNLLTGYHSLDTFGLAYMAAKQDTIPYCGKLDHIIEELGVEPLLEEDRHTAIGDCRVQMKVLLALLGE